MLFPSGIVGQVSGEKRSKKHLARKSPLIGAQDCSVLQVELAPTALEVNLRRYSPFLDPPH
jgi:hypothetical protein